MPFKIALYPRVSRDEQAKVIEGSLDSQIHRLKSYVDIKNMQEPGWGKIVEIYREEGVSAGSTNRPEFQRMMSDVRKGNINLLLVTDISRLSRNILDFCLLLEELKKYNAKFLSMKEQFDTSTASGEMMIYNMINLAQFERRQISERVSMNFHSRALRGLLNGAQNILGYKRDGKNPTYVIHEGEAADVRRIFTVFIEEGSLGKTLVQLEAEKIKPPGNPKRPLRLANNGKWSKQSLHNLLRNPTYIAIREVNKGNKGADPDSLKAYQKYEVVKASWPAIVDEETFARAQALLNQSQFKERQRLSTAEIRRFPLTGIVHCPDCGAPFFGQAAHGKDLVYRYYAHPVLKGEKVTCRLRRVKADELEEKLHQHLGSILADQGHLENVGQRIAASSESHQHTFAMKRKRLEKELLDINARLQKNFSMLEDSESGYSTALDMIKDRMEHLGKEKREKLNLLEALKDEMGPQLNETAESESLRERITEFRKAWPKATAAQQKQLIRNLFLSLVPDEDGTKAFYVPSTGLATMEKTAKAKVIHINFSAPAREAGASLEAAQQMTSTMESVSPGGGSDFHSNTLSWKNSSENRNLRIQIFGNVKDGRG